MDDEVAFEFAADVEEAVANVRDLAAAAQELADTAKEAADGVAGVSAPAGETATAVGDLAASAKEAVDGTEGIGDAASTAAGPVGELGAAAKEAAGGCAAITEPATAAADGIKAVGDAAGTASGELAAYKGAAAEAAAASTEVTGEAAGATAASAEASGAAADTAVAGEAAAGGLSKYKMALVGVGAGAAVAVDAAGKFQDSTTHLVTDAGESAKNLAMVQQGILSVSAATGTSASSITDAMYHIESGGFHGAAGLAILKTTAEGAKVGGADLDTTSKALIGTLTAYYGTSMTAAQATQRSTSLMNQLITTVGSGDMRMQDLAGSIHSVAPIAAAAGISFAQVGGAIATMTAQGMSADQVTQDLGHVIGSLSNPTNVMAVEMKAMGLNANSVARNLGKTGLSGTIDELRDAVLRNTQGGSVMLGMLRGMSPAAQDLANKILAGQISTKDLTAAMKELNPQQYALVSHFKSAATSVTGLQQTYTAAMSKMLGGQMGLNVGLMLTGTHMKDVATATANIAAAGAKAGSSVDNWSTIQSTFNFKMDQAKTSLEDAGIALGSALLPAVTAVIGPIAHFLALIASNRAASIALAVVIGGVLAGALGLKLAGALKDAKEGITAAGEGIEWLIGKMTGAKAASGAKAAATEAATAAQESQDAVNGASTAELEAQAVATEELTAVKETATVATEGLTEATAAADVAMDANPIGLIILAITALIAVIVLLVTHWKDVVQWFSDGTHEIAVLFDGWRHDVSAAVDAVAGFFQALPGRILGFLEHLPADMLNIGEDIINGLLHGVENAASGLLNEVSSLAGDVEKAFTDPLSIFSPSLVMFQHGWNYVQGIINGVKANAPNLLAAAGGLAGGTASSYAGSAIAPGGSVTHNFNVNVNAAGAPGSGLDDPRYEQALQAAVQEVTLRYAQLNAGNGLTPAWGR